VNWSNVRLILLREIRDQLRDRRTMFMIVVVPLLIYPLLGMSFFQLSQFTREHPSKVLVAGADQLKLLDEYPKLIEDGKFAESWLDSPKEDKLLELAFRRGEDSSTSSSKGSTTPEPTKSIADQVRDGDYHVALEFPPGFAERLRQFHDRQTDQETDAAGNRVALLQTWEALEPQIHVNSADEKSRTAHARVRRLLDRWKSAVIQRNLEENNIPTIAARPFDFRVHDVAGKESRDAATWARILPFVLLIWALTGAFYPAIDLCAGEKERGTLETLLSSPAERSEIVCGKLLTVMLFSVVTAVLNLINMAITGTFIIGQLKQASGVSGAFELSAPPLSSACWLLLALLPVSALFSALCLALAALARSSKEGQYYLLPLVLVTMPLMMLPMAPGVELNLGNSLIPITGVTLLLRKLLEGGNAPVLPYVPIVIAVTLGCCLLAIRWAIDQFNKESVLFRESERLDLGLRIKRMLTDRRETPSVAAAFACAALILIIKFFMQAALPQSDGNSFFIVAAQIFIMQIVIIAMPALLMMLLLTRDWRKTLLLDRWPGFAAILATLLLAVVLHPILTWMSTLVPRIYPMNPEVARLAGKVSEALHNAPNFWLPLVLIALLPAICEELAFRGFILSGFRHLGHKWWAIGLTAVFFGITHGILQQSLMAAVTGCIIGYVAVQTGSLTCCVIYHFAHNSLAFGYSSLQQMPTADYEKHRALRLLVRSTVEDGQTLYSYHWAVLILGGVIAAGLLYWLHRLPYQQTEEERLQKALQHQAAGSLPSHG